MVSMPLNYITNWTASNIGTCSFLRASAEPLAQVFLSRKADRFCCKLPLHISKGGVKGGDVSFSEGIRGDYMAVYLKGEVIDNPRPTVTRCQRYFILEEASDAKTT